MPNQNNGRRVALIAGLRTPFAKQGTAFKDLIEVTQLLWPVSGQVRGDPVRTPAQLFNCVTLDTRGASL